MPDLQLRLFGKQLFQCVVVSATVVLASACGGGDETETEDPENCLEAASWSPSITGMSSSNHDSNVSVTSDTVTASGALTGLAQDASARLVTVNIDMSSDLGDNGSLTLAAQVTGFPGELSGGAFPILVSLHDGTNELVNVSGEENGLFDCDSSGMCSPNNDVMLNQPSGFSDKTDWQQHQIPPFGYATTNVFPTCNWVDGGQPCEFTDTFFSGGKLRTGTYTAQYILLASNYSQINGFTATLDVRAIKKRDTTAIAASDNGALNLNVVFVGDENVNSAATAKGQTNLNALFTHVYDHYNQSGTGLKLGSITPYNWICSTGEEYANIDLNDLEELFLQTGNLPASAEGTSLNLFITSSIEFSSGSSNVVILGVAAAIGVTPINGTRGSGMVFSSLEPFDEMNPSCSTSSCPEANQEESFREMASTVSHEMGHALGLNHPTESDGSRDDRIPDTPECNPVVIGGEPTVTHNSCIATGANGCNANCPGYSDSGGTYCPTAQQCQFNHIMWYTVKNMNSSSGDGNLFSPHSSEIINKSSFAY